MNRQFPLAELAARLGLKLYGQSSLPITGVATLEQAGPGDLCFYVSSRYREQLRATRASVVIASEKAIVDAPCAVLLSSAPQLEPAVSRNSIGIGPSCSIVR